MPRRLISILTVAIWVAATASSAFAEPPRRVVVWKAQRQLWLMEGDRVLRRYPVSLGRQPVGPKQVRGDMRTPVGSYFIYEKREKTRFHRFLAINYPELPDAERAFRSGVISAGTWADIWVASKRRVKPPWDTPLGGFVGIHGTGAEGRRARLRQALDWTEGCIALSDRDVQELYSLTEVGTPVEIYENLGDETSSRIAASETGPSSGVAEGPWRNPIRPAADSLESPPPVLRGPFP